MADRIQTNPEILGGKPIIRGTRISVEFILELIASGADRGSIAAAYPQVEPEDVDAVAGYAARILKHDVLVDIDMR